MPHIFQINRESLKRKYAVYVVVAKSDNDVQLYVGKVGDNREGCNPLISRCGNHFSYNKMHSQLRNKLTDHESRDYTYVFEHFDDYSDTNKKSIASINEMERWLNQEIQVLTNQETTIKLLNPYKGSAYLNKKTRNERNEYRTAEASAKIKALVLAVKTILPKK